MVKLQCPCTAAAVGVLKVGDTVSVSGRVVTGRDRLHRHLFDGGACPVDLRNGAIYHCGPVVVRKDTAWVVRSAGPTTSMRQDAYMPALIERFRLRLVIGKGGMGEQTRQACARLGCVYLQAVGGAAVVQAQRIRSVAGVHFLGEFGATEALWEFDVEDFRAVVTIDARGRSLHKRVNTVSGRALRALINGDGKVQSR